MLRGKVCLLTLTHGDAKHFGTARCIQTGYLGVKIIEIGQVCQKLLQTFTAVFSWGGGTTATMLCGKLGLIHAAFTSTNIVSALKRIISLSAM